MKQQNNQTGSVNSVALIWKEVGQTPLEAIERYRAAHDEYEGVPMAYAGRLDPMAEGQLLILVGEACKERDRYLGLDKEYTFEVLLGWESDTHDILGVTSLNDQVSSFSDQSVESVLQQLRGRQVLPYPAFSSKTVAGKPLFLWALEERLDEIEIPTKEVEIYDFEYAGGRTVSVDEVQNAVHERISQVTVVDDPGKALGRDFRRKEVLETWDTNMAAWQLGNDFVILQFRCACSSGTYMRTLARMIGEKLGTQGLAWSIVRTEMGQWDGQEIKPIIHDIERE